MLERFFAFLGRHPRGFDAFVTVFWLVLTFLDERFINDTFDPWYLVPFLIVGSLALYWRRTRPLHAFCVLGAVTIILTMFDVNAPVPAALICACYSLGAHAEERRLSIASFVGLLVAGFAVVLISDPQYLTDTVFITLVLSIAWVTGDSLRTRRHYQLSVLERAERAEALRDSLAHQAVAEERTRIARDLHDVVAHSMSLMVVQASAARRVVATDPEASKAALEAIETVGRNSLGEMRRILGVLRGEEDPSVLAPQPDLAALESLVDEFKAAGLPVTMTVGGTPRSLAPSVELTAFRIVQESLTNTLKHAGASAATVVIDYEDDTLRIEVEDDGTGEPAFLPEAAGSQKGHVGMRERVAAFGGFFTARPRLDGGYHVSATLPLGDEDVNKPADTTTSTTAGQEPTSVERTT